MMEELKENYDYVILDCPPVEIVATPPSSPAMPR